ncbi:ABC transporter substrate-binding protein [Arthrobacter sp. 2MCAF14]|uniref:ABC transporter substrate-binding protein n=1 Tax=Arthrobacter sp. 2MCAF14 TaxID=3232982 RepID=UPI003F8FBE68
MTESQEPQFPLRLGSKASWLAYVAQDLGYFNDENLAVTLLNKQEIKDLEAGGGHLDAQVNWFQHAVFGVVNGKPQVAVMVLHDAPGITVMVSEVSKSEIRSAADFAGRRIAEGASHSAKGIVTSYLATRDGLPSGSYTPVMAAVDGRREAVTQGLQDGTVDVLTFMEPMTSYMKETGLVSTLYDLSTRESTVAEFGAVWPAESVLVTPEFAKDHPDVVQRLVNAMSRTLEYVRSSTPEQIAELLSSTYLAGKESAEAVQAIAKRWPTLSQGDYAISPESAQLIINAIKAAPFDDTVSGQTRAKVKTVGIDPSTLYTNAFVQEQSVVAS